MPKAMNLKKLKPVRDAGVGKTSRVGYIAPDVGTFFLDLSRGKGTASFVWSHDLGEDVDFHSGELDEVRELEHTEKADVRFYSAKFKSDQTPLIIYLQVARPKENKQNLRIVFATPDRPDDGFLWAWNAAHFHGHEVEPK